MTLTEWDAWQEGYFMKEEDEWCRMRWLGTIICNSSGRTYKNQIEPQDLLPLKMDKINRKKPKKLNIEEAYKFIEKYKLNVPELAQA